VVVWRAWVLFPEHQWVMVAPLFFLLTTFGEIWIIQLRSLTHMLGFASVLVMLTYLVAWHIISILTMIDCTIGASIATNLLATLLIAYKLWLVNISSNVNDQSMMITYSWQGLPKSHQKSWSEETTVSCAKSAVPSYRVRSLLPCITSEILILTSHICTVWLIMS